MPNSSEVGANLIHIVFILAKRTVSETGKSGHLTTGPEVAFLWAVTVAAVYPVTLCQISGNQAGR